jgi:signal peptidase I
VTGPRRAAGPLTAPHGAAGPLTAPHGAVGPLTALYGAAGPLTAPRRVTGILAVAVGAATVLVWARRRFMLITVRGTSMTPTYADGQRVLLRRGGYAAGDVVMFRSPVYVHGGMDWLVKRVAAMPGDQVPADMAERAAVPVVPAGRLLVRSDAGGLDSRHLGLIAHQDVIGRVCPARPGPAETALPPTGA